MWYVIVMAIYISCAAVAFAQSLVLNGIPSSVVHSSATETSRNVLGQEKALAARVLISKDGSKYIWTSRENRPLAYRQSGVVHIFMEMNGSGYVEVIDQNDLPDMLRDKTRPRFLYKEHLRSMLGNITYWGSTDAFTL